MKEKILVLVFGLFLGLAFSACSASDEIVPINIPSIDDDVCCSQDDENNINQILAGYKEVTGLSRQSVEGYTLKVYARTANLHVGYNDLYFAVEKTESGRHIKDFEVTALSPLMDMGMMVHSTPIADKYDQIESYPIFHTWVAPLMAGEWTLPISYRIKDLSGTLPGAPVTIDPTPGGQVWLKSFKWNDQTYYLVLSNPLDLKTGVNKVSAYVSKKGDNSALPYLPSTEVFTIDIYPTMPDMGNHTSPNNEALQPQDDGSYQGKLNLTMTGVWDIHLHVKDASGKTVAGGEGLSELYWTISI
ncbi:MAG: FixH family protein [Prevotella sp.]|nr:FixH family protein [Prevotella sp.]